MKAVISTTYDDKYLWYLPLTTFLWNKLGVDVICFMPRPKDNQVTNYKISVGNSVPSQMITDERYCLIINTLHRFKGKLNIKLFDAPEHKEATYAQCSRLYGACLDLPEDEILITSDVDMAVFNGEYLKQFDGNVQLIGSDLLEGEKMLPMCYCAATVKQWRDIMGIGSETYQQKLDYLLGGIEAEHFRGNYWCADQENLFKGMLNSKIHVTLRPRAKFPERFATKRYDRDDSYILDRLSPDTIDFHMNRPGYEPQNFEIILKILQYHYPNENFDWLIDFNEKYVNLMKK